MIRTQNTRTDPWRLELVVVASSSHTSGERRSISRDVERGVLRRLGPGEYVDRAAYDALGPEDAHIVRMRAHAATSRGTVAFSHWSAAVLHGLPVLRSRLDRLHVTTEDDDERHVSGVAHHHFLLEGGGDAVFSGLRATGVGRTVVDVAGATPLLEGVITADAALRAGVPREMLRAAIVLAGPRRASRRIRETIAFAHPGAESAAESRMRVLAYRIGVEVPRLQHPVRLRDGGVVYLDGYFPTSQVGIEVDGDVKYLDRRIAKDGAEAALIAEKRRQDEVLLSLRGLVRIGWVQSGDVAMLRSVLAQAGVRPPMRRPGLDEYCEAARTASPRFALRDPRWRT